MLKPSSGGSSGTLPTAPYFSQSREKYQKPLRGTKVFLRTGPSLPSRSESATVRYIAIM